MKYFEEEQIKKIQDFIFEKTQYFYTLISDLKQNKQQKYLKLSTNSIKQ